MMAKYTMHSICRIQSPALCQSQKAPNACPRAGLRDLSQIPANSIGLSLLVEQRETDMRKFILITAMVLASATAAGASEGTALASNDAPAVAEPAPAPAVEAAKPPRRRNMSSGPRPSMRRRGNAEGGSGQVSA